MTSPNPTPFGFSDEARRCADIITQAAVNGHAGSWVAIRLSDGGSDGVAYDDRKDAIRCQLHEQQCTYVQVQWHGMSPKAAQTLIRFWREAYSRGMRMADPEDSRRTLILPQRRF